MNLSDHLRRVAKELEETRARYIVHMDCSAEEADAAMKRYFQKTILAFTTAMIRDIEYAEAATAPPRESSGEGKG